MGLTYKVVLSVHLCVCENIYIYIYIFVVQKVYFPDLEKLPHKIPHVHIIANTGS